MVLYLYEITLLSNDWFYSQIVGFVLYLYEITLLSNPVPRPPIKKLSFVPLRNYTTLKPADQIILMQHPFCTSTKLHYSQTSP